MVRALGFSQGDFDPTDPGRLCRGRERWIDSFKREDNPVLSRLSISGAEFSDDSARDAKRGLSYSGLAVGELVRSIWPDHDVVAWAEDAHPRVVPEDAEGVEHYALREPGGPLRRWHSRWTLFCGDEASIDEAVKVGADVLLIMSELPEPEDVSPRAGQVPPLADGWVDPPGEGGLPEDVRGLLFLLTGYRVDGAPTRSFQAAALPEVLERCEAVVLVHQDKHGRCLGIYSKDAIEVGPVLLSLCGERGTLAVPFAIPPMLARWDRALWELRQEWDEVANGEYPVPPAAEDAGGWGRRGPRGRRRGRREFEE